MTTFYTLEDHFDDGAIDLNVFDGTTDDDSSQITFPHYSTLAGKGMTPYSGSYCMQVLMSGTADQATIRSDALNITVGATDYISFAVYLGKDVVFTADDAQIIMSVENTSSVIQVAVLLVGTAATGDVRFGAISNEGGNGGLMTNPPPIERGVWYWVDIEMVTHASDGTYSVSFTKEGDSLPTGTLTDSALDNTNVTHAELGTNGVLTTTTGTILFDSFIYEAAGAVPAPPFRWHSRETRIITGAIHAFVGPGMVENVSLQDIQGGSGNATIAIYDTDTGQTEPNLLRVELKASIASETIDTAQTPVRFQRGAYCVMTGTTPCANVQCTPRYMGRANLITYGLAGR